LGLNDKAHEILYLAYKSFNFQAKKPLSLKLIQKSVMKLLLSLNFFEDLDEFKKICFKVTDLSFN
jgi:hypothetical protein